MDVFAVAQWYHFNPDDTLEATRITANMRTVQKDCLPNTYIRKYPFSEYRVDYFLDVKPAKELLNELLKEKREIEVSRATPNLKIYTVSCLTDKTSLSFIAKSPYHAMEKMLNRLNLSQQDNNASIKLPAPCQYWMLEHCGKTYTIDCGAEGGYLS